MYRALPRARLKQQRMISYVNILKSAHQQGRDKWHLNASEVAQLEGQLSNAYDRSANWISNLLCVGYGICRAPLSGGDEGAPKARRRSDAAARSEVDGPIFRTAPNPADAWVSFNYTFKTEPEKAFVIVRDAMGKEVSTIAMRNKQGQLVMDTRQLTKGMYAVSYTRAGTILHVDRLIVR